MSNESPVSPEVSAATPETVPLFPDANLADVIKERDEFRDKWTRTLADLDNYRRRIQKEQEEDRKFQSMPLLKAILPAIDGIHRAFQSAAASQKTEDILKGLELVQKQFDAALKGIGAEVIPAVGLPFDSNVHEAIQQLPSTEHPAMTVSMEVEKGWKLHERIVRPSKVIVSSGPPAAS